MVSSTWFDKNLCNLASSSSKIPFGMLCCGVYRPLRLESIESFRALYICMVFNK